MKLKDDKQRYQYLVRLHTICTFFFVVRFIVLCTDLSSAKSDAIAFPVIILLLELGSSFITFVANLVYVFMRYLSPILFESDREKVGCCSQAFVWSLGTLTCIRCKCHRENPILVLLTRFLIFLLFEIMRFVAFILACTCANRYGPIGLGYAILAAFTFIPGIWLLVVEYLHFYRLWFHYRPDVGSNTKPKYYKSDHPFIPLSITNDQQTNRWRTTRCKDKDMCLSKNPLHAVMFHSGHEKYAPDQTQDRQIVIGFHQTSHAAAYSIAKTNFELSKDGWIGPGVYFATSLDHTEFKANQFGAYICATVDLGCTKRIKDPKEWKEGEKLDTVYYEHPKGADEFCVHNTKQILSWVIVVDQDPNNKLLAKESNDPLPSGNYVDDYLEDIYYRGCLSEV